jgi:ABC-2 type transport system ATP-binding protein
MIRTRGLTRQYDATTAVDRLDLDVARGEILGFLGPNGAGKSTTVKMLIGMVKPTAGTAEVAGFDIGREPLEVKRRIGYVPEAGTVYESLSAIEYLDLVGSLHHLDPRVAAERAADLLSHFGLEASRDQRLGSYSKGMRQKVLLAAALIHKPDVLFLDEPLSGLDANATLFVKDLLRGLAAQGCTVFFCSHILDVVERLCSRIVIIDRGRAIADGRVEEITGATGTATLEEAFHTLTGTKDVGQLTAEVLAALERS